MGLAASQVWRLLEYMQSPIERSQSGVSRGRLVRWWGGAQDTRDKIPREHSIPRMSVIVLLSPCEPIRIYFQGVHLNVNKAWTKVMVG